MPIWKKLIGYRFEPLPICFVASDIRQARDAMPLKASM